MDLLEALRAILDGKSESLILADWAEDFRQGHPELETYLRRLRDPETLRLKTVIDFIVKFGEKKQRSLTMKMLRRIWRSRDKIAHKGVLLAYAKKRWSLGSWYVTDKMKEILDVGSGNDRAGVSIRTSPENQ